jgi:hypothetical protein
MNSGITTPVGDYRPRKNLMYHSDLKLIGLAAEDPGALQQKRSFSYHSVKRGPGLGNVGVSAIAKGLRTHGKFLVAYSEDELSEMEP